MHTYIIFPCEEHIYSFIVKVQKVTNTGYFLIINPTEFGLTHSLIFLHTHQMYEDLISLS